MRMRYVFRDQSGTTLYELLIVVGILLIIATIAIPSYLQSKQTANETAALASLRTIFVAETVYTSDNHGLFGDLPTLVRAGALLDSRFATSDTKPVGGYYFKPGTVAPTGGKLETLPDGFNMQAYVFGHSGRYEYFIQSDGTLRYADAVNGNHLPAGISPGDPVSKVNF